MQFLLQYSRKTITYAYGGASMGVVVITQIFFVTSC